MLENNLASGKTLPPGFGNDYKQVKKADNAEENKSPDGEMPMLADYITTSSLAAPQNKKSLAMANQDRLSAKKCFKALSGLASEEE